MSLEKYGSIWAIVHCYPVSKPNLCDERDIFISTTWIKLRSMYKNEKKILGGAKINHRIYLLQEIPANYLEEFIIKEESN